VPFVRRADARRGDDVLLADVQAVLDRWASRRQIVPRELIDRIAPTRLEGIGLRGVFRFPVERYANRLLPSQTAPKTRTAA
jgi:hypothetical protein